MHSLSNSFFITFPIISTKVFVEETLIKHITSDNIPGSSICMNSNHWRNYNTSIQANNNPDFKSNSKIDIIFQDIHLFYLNDGTIITFFSEDGKLVCKPIFQRINEERSLLKSSNDPSFLVFSILNIMVDYGILFINNLCI